MDSDLTFGSESSFSSSVLPHDVQVVTLVPRTRASNWWLQRVQTKSKMGMYPWDKGGEVRVGRATGVELVQCRHPSK